MPRGSVDTEEMFVEWLTRLVACAEMAVGEMVQMAQRVTATAVLSLPELTDLSDLDAATLSTLGSSRFDPEDAQRAPARYSSTAAAGRRTRRMSVAGKTGHRRGLQIVRCGEMRTGCGLVKRRGQVVGVEDSKYFYVRCWAALSEYPAVLSQQGKLLGFSRLKLVSLGSRCYTHHNYSGRQRELGGRDAAK